MTLFSARISALACIVVLFWPVAVSAQADIDARQKARLDAAARAIERGGLRTRDRVASERESALAQLRQIIALMAEHGLTKPQYDAAKKEIDRLKESNATAEEIRAFEKTLAKLPLSDRERKKLTLHDVANAIEAVEHETEGARDITEAVREELRRPAGAEVNRDVRGRGIAAFLGLLAALGLLVAH